MSAWMFLTVAIALEVVGTVFLKLSNGFEKWHWGALSILCYVCCFWAFAPALKAIPVGVAYALWAGIGILAVTLIGFAVFREQLGAVQLVFIALIAIGAVGLRLTTTTAA